MLISNRDLRFVRRQAIVNGRLRPPDVAIDEVLDALREEIVELRQKLAVLEREDGYPRVREVA